MQREEPEQLAPRKHDKRAAIITAIGTLFGVVLGLGLALLALRIVDNLMVGKDFSLDMKVQVLIYALASAVGGISFFFITRRFQQSMRKFMHWVQRKLGEISSGAFVAAIIGLVVGLLIAYLVSPLFEQIPTRFLSVPLAVLLYAGLGWVGVIVGLSRNWDFSRKSVRTLSKGGESSTARILDTSVVIDGRIFDILKTGFIDGPLVIPEFVLAELQKIADSADSLKRSRGRRGLEVLGKIQKEMPEAARIEGMDFPDIAEVDVKLLRLAQHIGGVIVTNDYNLNKVAEVTGVGVLNINELANAVKPMLVSGEEMTVHILREGKELGQGVAYLDDGTMIVVENGKRHIGDVVEVVVTSVLQTAAGRMIFTRIKGGEKAD